MSEIKNGGLGLSFMALNIQSVTVMITPGFKGLLIQKTLLLSQVLVNLW